eukprot:7238445-Lingulodinium_polyedra.AAC.1
MEIRSILKRSPWSPSCSSCAVRPTAKKSSPCTSKPTWISAEVNVVGARSTDVKSAPAMSFSSLPTS